MVKILAGKKRFPDESEASEKKLWGYSGYFEVIK